MEADAEAVRSPADVKVEGTQELAELRIAKGGAPYRTSAGASRSAPVPARSLAPPAQLAGAPLPGQLRAQAQRPRLPPISTELGGGLDSSPECWRRARSG